MKIINRIKALFKLNGKVKEINLTSAEIKPGKAYLHTDDNETLIIDSDNISILLDGDYDFISEKEISKTKKEDKTTSKIKPENKEKKTIKQSDSKRKKNKEKSETRVYYLQKKTFSVTLFEDEYEYLNNMIKESGYKRSDFIIASINSAKKKSFDQELKKIKTVHKQRNKESKENKETSVA